LLNTEAGKHKVYVSVLHPLKNRVEYAAKQAGLAVPEVQMLPEPEFWQLVQIHSTKDACSEGEAFFHLLDLTPDMGKQPVHPFLLV